MRAYYEEYAQINGIEQYFLHYPSRSDAVILFLHGGPGQTEAHLSYKTVASDTAYSVVYYDQRGTGKTQAKNRNLPSEITLDVLIDDLAATVEYVRKKYQDKRLIMLGHSWGSILAIEYLKKIPRGVDAYVGMGQVVNFKQGERTAYRHCYDLASAKDKKKLQKIVDYPNSISSNNINDLCHRFRKIQERYNLTGYGGGKVKLAKIFVKSPIFKTSDIYYMSKAMRINANLLQLLAEYDTGNYVDFSIPIYFICGQNDWQVPSVDVEAYYNRITAPDKNLYYISNAGHLTDLDNPIEYNEALTQICKRVESAATV